MNGLISGRSIITAACLGFLPAAFSGTPLWTFQPLTATTITIPSNGTKVVQYVVTNQSRVRHNLIMSPIKGITQLQGAGYCSNYFTLDYHQSCILSLSIDAAALGANNVVGGPVVCQNGNLNQCYRPSERDNLNISKGPSIYSIGGNLISMGNGGTIKLQLNNGEILTLNTNGTFTFPTPLNNGSSYDVTVLSQPNTQQTCRVEQGTGTVSGSNVTNIDVLCTLNLPYYESFSESQTADPWVLPAGASSSSVNSACLTASGANVGSLLTCLSNGDGGYTGNTPDSSGEGALRLTSAINSEEGGIIFGRLFNLSQGFSIQFTAYSYAGHDDQGNTDQTGGDGFSFFFIDGENAIPTVLGPPGAGLGYGHGSGGISGGYIGIGFDEWGNFARNSNETRVPDRIAVRGATANNNPLLVATNQLTPPLSCPESECSNADGRQKITSVSTGRNVYKINISAQGAAEVYRNNVSVFSATQSNLPPSPTFYVGFAASTGDAANIHEITDLLATGYGSLYPISGTLNSSTSLPNTLSLSYTVNSGSGQTGLSVTEQLILSATGSFVFPSSLTTGFTYMITAPAGCQFAVNGSNQIGGTVGTGPIDLGELNCS